MNQDILAQIQSVAESLDEQRRPVALAALQALAKPTDHRGNFTSLIGLEIVTAENGRAHTRLEVEPHLLNRINILHGGVAYSMADVTTGVAAMTRLSPGQKIVTQDLHYRYHGMVKNGTIDAYAEVIHFGSRTVVLLCKLFVGESLIGSADGTFALINQEELDR